MTLEPVVVVARAEDLAYLRSIVADLPPMPPDAARAIRMNGWTDEMVRLGHILTSLAGLIRNGDLTLTEEDDRG